MMALADFFAAGGPVMLAITLAGLAAYALLSERALWLLGPAGRRAAGSYPRRELAFEAERGFALAAACIAIAPLLGLLGTVGGMITTFDALLRGGGTSGVAIGVGEALITTQYGLAVAAPALVAWALLRRRAELLTARARLAAEPPA